MPATSPANIIREYRFLAAQLVTNPEMSSDPLARERGAAMKAHFESIFELFERETGLKINAIAVSFGPNGGISKANIAHEAI